MDRGRFTMRLECVLRGRRCVSREPKIGMHRLLFFPERWCVPHCDDPPYDGQRMGRVQIDALMRWRSGGPPMRMPGDEPSAVEGS
jgi:hypothetical protein